jgi:23S rRNA (uracil1939-C5)-methyltransferase
VARRRRKALPPEPVELTIHALSHDGRGVARNPDGKTVFVHGALAGETVMARLTQTRKSHDEADAVEVLAASPDRVVPHCAHFGVCGGCSLQHLRPDAQVAAKQQALLDALEHIGKVAPERVLAPLVNETPWGYRRKARLGVKYVPKKGKVLVGFRERGTPYITDLTECPVLHPKIAGLLQPLGALIGGLGLRERVPQVEVAMDDSQLVLIFRVLDEPSASDLEALAAFGREHALSVYLQPGGPDTVAPLGEAVELAYELPDFAVTLGFLPTDFTQVNSGINRQMVNHALALLEVAPEEQVLDLFCGVGNFSLPLATRARRVVGVEGDAGLVERARANAARNGLDNIGFHVANLYADLERPPWLGEHYDKVLLDPPRSGAFEVLEHLPKLGAKRLVYVSCYPGTLARDAGELVDQLGYRLLAAGVMDMFPHTAHVESIALFEQR